MSSRSSAAPSMAKPVRLWPGVAAVSVQWFLWAVFPRLFPDAGAGAMLGGLACGLVVLLWWIFFSRLPWAERGLGIGLMVLGILVSYRTAHASIAGGMMGFMVPIFSLPLVCVALVAWAWLGRQGNWSRRFAGLGLAVLGAFGGLMLVRTDGMTGGSGAQLHWRWTPTPEERLLQQAASRGASSSPPASVPVPGGAAPSPATAPAPVAEWPGFRGLKRDGVVWQARILTNWTVTPPRELWRQPVGPAWSSFAVQGDWAYTQEQRGEEEVVSCYHLRTGAVLWRHTDPVRFYESNAGAGPRGTPAIDRNRLYALGGTGLLNALNATDGAVIWSRNAAEDAGRKVPEWGMAGSPLVLEDQVIVAVGGRLASYDAQTGKPRWSGPAYGWGYSSPHSLMLGGVTQVVLLNGAGALSVAPSDGHVLWTNGWKSDGIVQPAVTEDGDLLIGSGSGLAAGVGVLRLSVRSGAEGWSAEEKWKSIGLKPYFNDFVVHRGHAYGFDGGMVACIDLADGRKRWKGGRYGYGQLIAVAEQDLLLVLTERGEVVLVRAVPEDFVEVARRPAIEGKTWNHPVLAGGVLLVRNDREMAAWEMTGVGPK